MVSNMNIWALDLGLKTGWAFRTEQDGVFTGTVRQRRKTKDAYGIKFMLFESFLNDSCDTYGMPDIVVYEGVQSHKGVYAAHCYGGYKAVLTAWCEKHGVYYEPLSVQEIKRYATGKGAASKTEMIYSAVKKGYLPQDDNEADAIAILHAFMEKERLPWRKK